MGSSPLARGLLLKYWVPGRISGIIPARAGFTPTRTSASFRPPDHPRSRGVYSIWGSACTMAPGSSPLARGLHQVRGRVGMVGRIIPARAGFTAGPGAGVRRRWDHPRSRGVYVRDWARRRAAAGSSPLARGLQMSVKHSGAVKGIIPARAGFTRQEGRRCRRRQDHPRSRGVYCRPGSTVPPGSGSSPLARGLLRERRAG